MVDLLPFQLQRWQAVEAVARDCFQRAGFGEIRTPLLESTDLFRRSIGEATDVVDKEMYSFLDQGERSCSLRPEGTAAVVRAVLQHGLLSLGSQKLWYTGPMFRYERPKVGRQRQFQQIGVEWIGAGSPRNEVEVIALAWDFLETLGLRGLELQINSVGSFEDRHAYRIALISWLEQRLEELDDDTRNSLFINPLSILDAKNIIDKDILDQAPTLLDSLSSANRERFEEVQIGLKALGIPYRFNPRLVRGLDYYCHTAFEITSNLLGSQATVCGGGRYDGLVKNLGGPDTPAFGWALGMERLMLLLESAVSNDPKGVAACLINVVSPDAYLVNRGNQASVQSLAMARELRRAELTIELDETDEPFEHQFNRAIRCGAVWALILGDDEVEQNVVRLKRLQGEPQEHVVALSAISSVVNILRIS